MSSSGSTLSLQHFFPFRCLLWFFWFAIFVHCLAVVFFVGTWLDIFVVLVMWQLQRSQSLFSVFISWCWNCLNSTPATLIWLNASSTGWLDSKCDIVSSIYKVLELKISKIKVTCIFIGNRHLTFILWIQFLSHILGSTASNRKTAKNMLKWWIIDDPSHIETPKIGYFGAGLKETWSSVSFLMKWGCWGHWCHLGCGSSLGHWPGNHSVC